MQNNILCLRLKMDKENLLKQSSTVTNQLLSVSRQLVNTSQQSLDTLETLRKIEIYFNTIIVILYLFLKF